VFLWGKGVSLGGGGPGSLKAERVDINEDHDITVFRDKSASSHALLELVDLVEDESISSANMLERVEALLHHV